MLFRSGYLALAYLLSDSMKVWEVPDLFEYNGKKCYVPLIDLRLNLNLTKVILPYFSKEISGFSNSLSLEEVVFKEPEYEDIKRTDFANVELYSESFSNCPSLKRVVLPEGITDIEDFCFTNCKNLTEVILPNSLEDISHHVLSECDKLERIYIPAGVESIGKEFLSSCPNLKGIIVDPKNPYYDSRENCNAIIDSKTGQLIVGCNSTVIPGSEIGRAHV